MKNSIEEDIKILEKLDYLLDDVYSTGLVEDEERNKFQYAIEHILSDYKRVLKENEELKRDKENIIQDNLEIKDKCLIIAKNLEKKGKIEIAEYILAQIGATAVWECGESYNNYIPKQKILEKIKILRQQDSEWADELSEPDSNFKNIDRNLKRIKNQIDVLEELLN